MLLISTSWASVPRSCWELRLCLPCCAGFHKTHVSYGHGGEATDACNSKLEPSHSQRHVSTCAVRQHKAAAQQSAAPCNAVARLPASIEPLPATQHVHAEAGSAAARWRQPALSCRSQCLQQNMSAPDHNQIRIQQSAQGDEGLGKQVARPQSVLKGRGSADRPSLYVSKVWWWQETLHTHSSTSYHLRSGRHRRYVILMAAGCS